MFDCACSWISRIEFLEEHIDRRVGVWSAIPAYVRQHDGELEDQVWILCVCYF